MGTPRRGLQCTVAALLCVVIVVIMDFGTDAGGASIQDVVLFPDNEKASLHKGHAELSKVPPSALGTHRTNKLPCDGSCRKAVAALTSAKLAVHTANENVAKEFAKAKKLFSAKRTNGGQKKAATTAILEARQAATAARQAYSKAQAKYTPVLRAFDVPQHRTKPVHKASNNSKARAEAKQKAINAVAATKKARLKVQRLQHQVHQSLKVVEHDEKLDDVAWQAAARAIAPEQFHAVHPTKAPHPAMPARHQHESASRPANKWLKVVRGAWSGVEKKEHHAVQVEERRIDELHRRLQKKAAEAKVTMANVEVAEAQHKLKNAEQHRTRKIADEAAEAMIKSQTHSWADTIQNTVGWGYQAP